jgi:antitoxin component of MazEF toxin-antitoxin module
MKIKVKVRKYQNYLGVILPNNLIEQYQLKENDKLLIEVVKEGD